ncbi:MAG: hypothetical protein NC912_04950 [Candidatus Omnitrophica bacterium]|nr:hypothetical protein [Candidatus Omnitrophota bacterium]
MKGFHGLIIFLICILNLIGCKSIKELTYGIAGVSTRVLEENRKSAIVEVFAYDYLSCYKRCIEILKKIGAYIYKQDIKKYMIAIYVSEEDTTPVGLFFKEIDKNHTQIEISSPSTYAKELISEKLYHGLKSP